MGTFRLHFARSLDGFMAGPDSFHTPVFILTHHARKPLPLQGIG
jgi:hypothetical protein